MIFILIVGEVYIIIRYFLKLVKLLRNILQKKKQIRQILQTILFNCLIFSLVNITLSHMIQMRVEYYDNI